MYKDVIKTLFTIVETIQCKSLKLQIKLYNIEQETNQRTSNSGKTRLWSEPYLWQDFLLIRISIAFTLYCYTIWRETKLNLKINFMFSIRQK